MGEMRARATPLILVADDEPGSLFGMRSSFEEAGYEVVEARDGRSALLAFSEHHPDLVVLDVRMP